MSIGLSTTAIGGRTFAQALNIYDCLKPLLKLDYLELAIGSKATVNLIPANLPIIIHNDWVYTHYGQRLKVDLLRDEGWEKYKELVRSHHVLAFSWHFPKRKPGVVLEQILKRRLELELYLERPFSLELMPTKDYFGNLDDHNCGLLDQVPLCVDLSHLNIWAKGNDILALDYLEQVQAQAVNFHVSTNSGYRDSHSLIPKDCWVNSWLENTPTTKSITYEALPFKYNKFDRIRPQNYNSSKF